LKECNLDVILRAENIAMTITVNLSTGLRALVTDGLQRGQPPAMLIEMLVRSRVEPQIAAAVVDAFVKARAAGSAPPEQRLELDRQAPRYEYEAPRIATGNIIRVANRAIRVLQRLEQPIIVTLEGVLADAECERLIELARPRLRASTVVDAATGTNAVADYRNSDGMFFRPLENPFIADLDQRVAALMNCPVENGEGLQVLHYGPGGRYRPHFDFLIPSNPGSSESIARSGQRISTLIIYLNDVAEGGATVFPDIGFSVVPRRGNALYFEYTNTRMQVDQKSRHGGAPVDAGEKWIITKWMRARRFVPAHAQRPS
jgi:prolyl 4-hydroxylase